MKKYQKIILEVLSILALSAGIAFAAFPSALTNWVAGTVITSEWLNDIEGKIGITGSASTTSLDWKINSTASKLGSIAALATTTGNIIVGSSTGGWNILGVGTDGYFLTASSSQPLGVAWGPSSAGSGAVSTSSPISANNFPFWSNTTGGLSGTSTLTISGSQLLQSSNFNVSGTTGLQNFTFITATGTGLLQVATATVTNGTSLQGLTFVNATGTTIDVTGSSIFQGFTFTNATGTGNLQAATLAITGQSTLGSVSSTNLYSSGQLQVTGGASLFQNISFSNATGTGIIDIQTLSSTNATFVNATATSIADISGNKYSTSTTRFVQFEIESPNAVENDSFNIFKATSTISKVFAVNKTDGDTVTFNLHFGTSRGAATSSMSHVFSSDQTVTATTTPFSSTTFASTSVPANSVMIFSTDAASSSQFFLELYFTTP